MALTLYATCTIILSLAYFILILVYLYHWKNTARHTIPDSFLPSTSITVLIPIRNEAENIVTLLDSILSNKYPTALLEIIVIDDHSTDQGVAMIKKISDPRIKILSLATFKLPLTFNSFKKFGIEEAVKMATGELIITTDGDCVVPKNWLRYFAHTYAVQQKSFIAAPVNFAFKPTPLSAFQALDFMGMMLITGANIRRQKSLLCNGANLGYSRSLFLEVGGYEGILNRASGDDVMLMNRVAERNASSIAFLKNHEATVLTTAAPTWKAFCQQRLRWASKNGNSKDFFLKLELGIAYLLCVNIMVMPILILILMEIQLFQIWILMIGIKFLTDFILLYSAASFFDKRYQLRGFVSSFFIHIFYVSFIGTRSLFKKEYTWKGRKVI